MNPATPNIPGLLGQPYNFLSDNNALLLVLLEEPVLGNDKEEDEDVRIISKCAGEVTVDASSKEVYGSCPENVAKADNVCLELDCYSLVCSEHGRQGREELVRDRHPLTTLEGILAMRAYACQDCATALAQVYQLSMSQEIVLPILWTNATLAGAGNLATRALNVDLEIQHKLHGATGCQCAAKLFSKHLCTKTTHELAEKINDRVVETHAKAKVGDNSASNKYSAWIYLQCRDWVLVEKGQGNQPVPGWDHWFRNPPPGWTKSVSQSPDSSNMTSPADGPQYAKPKHKAPQDAPNLSRSGI
ncbi:hypothetical protein N3K66_000508 [Trichothecium roseum]|uniref:Uncharacterized protein n=1 Tax=Trichothecium roseum TaxID=47278 RepID=A0ACC0VCF3_9HYPO|nr:hypothetical protein N3K66_000508 [Trichothecium roseum]